MAAKKKASKKRSTKKTKASKKKRAKASKKSKTKAQPKKKKTASRRVTPESNIKVSGGSKKVSVYGVKKPGEKTKYDVRITTQKFGKAPKEYHFVLNSGEKIKSIQELAESMQEMGEDVFKHHANEFKNDFSTWLEDVFNEKKLAEEIKKTQDRLETEVKLLRHMVKKMTNK